MDLDRVRLSINDYRYRAGIKDKIVDDYGTTEQKQVEGKEIKSEYTEKILNDSTKKLRDAANIFSRRLSFSIDKETNRVIVKVVDTETDKVIKEIPPEQVIELAAKIQKMIGLLVDEER